MPHDPNFGTIDHVSPYV